VGLSEFKLRRLDYPRQAVLRFARAGTYGVVTSSHTLRLMVGFVVLLFALPLLGLVLHRWSAILLPLLAWPTYYIGRNQGWWGCCGTGDGWEVAAIWLTVLGVITTAGAVWLGKIFATRFARPS
jgi:hypothetical protein